MIRSRPNGGFSIRSRAGTRNSNRCTTRAGRKRKPREGIDVLRFLMEYSPFLNREDNRWMLTVLEVIRSTSLYFQPQIRTKIMNEGWASYWHEKLFLGDDRIGGHEVEYALVNAKVTSMPRVGLNPYAPRHAPLRLSRREGREREDIF